MKILQNPELGANLRIVELAGEPWFVAKDVCAALGIANSSQALTRLDADEKGVNLIHPLLTKGVIPNDPLSKGGCQILTPGGPQNMAVVSESGLYALILRSDKPNARKFRKWVTSEVLPQIRKSGVYGNDPEVSRLEIQYETALEILEYVGERLAALTGRPLSRIGIAAPALPMKRAGKPRLDYHAEAEAMPLPCYWHEAVAWAMARWGVPRIKTVEMRVLRMIRRGILGHDENRRLIRVLRIKPMPSLPVTPNP